MATKSVTKESTDNRITESLVFGTGKSLTFDAGSTLSLGTVTLTGTIGFANGGTNATTQRTAQANLGGWYFSNLASADGTRPATNGAFTRELATTGSGNLWTWDSVKWRSRFVIGNLTVDSSLDGDTGQHASEVYFKIGDSDTAIDNVLLIQNNNNTKHSAIAFRDLNGAEQGAIGYGNPGAVTPTFADAQYWETFADSDMRIVGVGAAGRNVWAKFEGGQLGSSGDFLFWKDSVTAVPANSLATVTLNSEPIQPSVLLRPSAGITGTGTVSGSVGTQTMTGASTVFTTQLQGGDRVTIGVQTFTVRAIASNTSLTFYETIGTTFTTQAFTFATPSQRWNGESAGRYKVTTSDAVVISVQSTERPHRIYDLTGTRAWGFTVGTSNSGEFYFQNLTANSSPFVINGDAPNSVFRLTSTGLTLTGALTATTGIVGTTTNDSPAAGRVGETISSAVAVGSAVSLTTATTANVTSISLTAGDWEVSGNVSYSLTGATATAFSAGVTITSATVPTDGTECYSGVVTTSLTAINGITMPPKRISLAGTTTVYLVASSTFTLGTEAAFGSIKGRRVR